VPGASPPPPPRTPRRCHRAPLTPPQVYSVVGTSLFQNVFTNGALLLLSQIIPNAVDPLRYLTDAGRQRVRRNVVSPLGYDFLDRWAARGGLAGERSGRGGDGATVGLAAAPPAAGLHALPPAAWCCLHDGLSSGSARPLPRLGHRPAPLQAHLAGL
jgi:hypothetical protein